LFVLRAEDAIHRELRIREFEEDTENDCLVLSACHDVLAGKPCTQRKNTVLASTLRTGLPAALRRECGSPSGNPACKEIDSMVLGMIDVTPAALAACSDRWLKECISLHEATVANFGGEVTRSRLVSEYPIDAAPVAGIKSVLFVTEGTPRKTSVLLPMEVT
jgi:hypothetical protein